MPAISISNLPPTENLNNSAVFAVSQIDSANDNDFKTYKYSAENLKKNILDGIDLNINTAYSLSDIINNISVDSCYPNCNALYEIYQLLSGALQLSGNNKLLAGENGNDFTEANLKVNTISSVGESPVNVKFLKEYADRLGFMRFPDYSNAIPITNVKLKKTITKYKQKKSGAVWKSIETVNITESYIYIPYWEKNNYVNQQEKTYSVVQSDGSRFAYITEYTPEDSDTSTHFDFDSNTGIVNLKSNGWIRYIHTNWLKEDVSSYLYVWLADKRTWLVLARSLSYATTPQHGITGDSGVLPFKSGTKIKMSGYYQLTFLPAT